MAHSTTPHHRQLLSPRRIGLLVIGLLGLYLLLPEWGHFQDSLALWRHVQLKWLVVSVAAFAATYPVAATLYRLLAIKPLNYFRTIIVQVASMFANRLLPAGIGAIGVSYKYLRRNKHSRAQASAIIALNNTIGIVGHGLLLLGVVGIGGGRLVIKISLRHSLYGAAGVVLVIAGFSLWRQLRRRAVRALSQIIGVLMGYRQRPRTLLVALGCSLMLTGAYALSLYACSRALGIDIGFAKVFIVMTIGVIGATAVPTPGGLGGAEAGIVGGLALYGVSSSDGLAVALLYRLLTYWLSLLLGAGAFIWLEHREYI